MTQSTSALETVWDETDSETEGKAEFFPEHQCAPLRQLSVACILCAVVNCTIWLQHHHLLDKALNDMWLSYSAAMCVFKSWLKTKFPL